MARKSPKPYHRLTESEFYEIKSLVEKGLAPTVIYKKTGRGYGTIARISAVPSYKQYKKLGSDKLDKLASRKTKVVREVPASTQNSKQLEIIMISQEIAEKKLDIFEMRQKSIEATVLKIYSDAFNTHGLAKKINERLASLGLISGAIFLMTAIILFMLYRTLYV